MGTLCSSAVQAAALPAMDIALMVLIVFFAAQHVDMTVSS
jgi:hypothetical protein